MLQIKKICLASSALFSLSACVFGWAAPIGAALGCAADVFDHSPEIEQQYRNAVQEAIDKTRRSLPVGQIRILDELSNSSFKYDSLSDIIRKTETYRINYCTPKDVQNVIKIFELNFKSILPKPEYGLLFKKFVLATEFASLEQLKQISELIDYQSNLFPEINSKLSNTYYEAHNSRKILTKFDNCVCFLTQELSFILVEMAIFLLMGLVSRSGYPHFWVLAAFLSYLITSILTHFLEKTGYVKTSLLGIVESPSSYRSRIAIALSSILIPSLISIACYMLFVLSTDRYLGDNYQFYYSIMVLFIGGIISKLLRLPKSPLW